MRRLLWIFPFFLVACGAMKIGREEVSVEGVLRQTLSVAEELDREAAQAAPSRGTASIRAVSFLPPLVRMKVNSPFGKRRGHRHEGLDLKAEKGTPILASAKGVVVYADDWIDGYGNMVILRHTGGYSTLYAHASRLNVKKGERVAAGACIAYVGNSGRSSGPHLHFEVREGFRPVNPARWVLGARRLAGER